MAGGAAVSTNKAVPCVNLEALSSPPGRGGGGSWGGASRWLSPISPTMVAEDGERRMICLL
jgi:hypothetical protein